MNKGTKYEETKNLGLSEIAKLIKKDIKTSLPVFSNIRVSVKGIVSPMMTITVDTEGFLESEEAKSGLRILLRTYADAYNFDDSDSREDYSHCRFFVHIRVY